MSQRTAGDVASVVANAISTIMANSVGEMTPISRPMLSAISSINPRVFINIPRAEASRQPRPLSRAAATVPPNLPTVATRMITPVTLICGTSGTSTVCGTPRRAVSSERLCVRDILSTRRRAGDEVALIKGAALGLRAAGAMTLRIIVVFLDRYEGALKAV